MPTLTADFNKKLKQDILFLLILVGPMCWFHFVADPHYEECLFWVDRQPFLRMLAVQTPFKHLSIFREQKLADLH